MTLLVLAGATAGLGVFLLVYCLAPAAPIRLDTALAQLTGDQRDGPGLRRLPAALRALPIPHADLALLDISPDAFLLRKLGYAAAGLTVPVLVVPMALAAGTSIPWQIPVGAGPLLAAALFLIPDQHVRRRAAARRTEFTDAVITYTDLIALAIKSGVATNEAMETAARTGRSRPFQMITEEIVAARRANQPDWQALVRLGRQMNVQELADLGAIAELASDEGAAVVGTLIASGQSLRRRRQSQARAQANASTTTMSVPLALFCVGYLILLIYPVLATL